MEHSLRGYLERQSTEVLEMLLGDCLNNEDYWHAALEILKVLKQRDVSTDISPEVLQALEPVLRRFENEQVSFD